ncbi:CDP-alcohol phosphatidyltransferase family protein [Morganella psychrotolerans]|uniref:CDP-alcohol phosphatidyltransferase family protein n=1 Tax=Morganella psychrotolerans TaxID=368603 RepID=A0A5M9RBT8_9GAMM|nr:CDP-alcohol phosphatidyltransferase family protein [Morganella psychrotolerans]KAA8717468.1 CDP-alcohol phosphatidyltransferase family protein [Morganella psychrotolerans]OBU08262.1 CDP-alcohol phosphatidyltransferase [Morganella psychrotolerans]
MDPEIKDRRPIKARQTRWATASARWLQQRGATPNGISVASVVFALFAALAFFGALNSEITVLRILLFVLAALLVQGRLICNLLDGMVAVEGGLRSPVGAVFNDLPDRISDSLILIGVGYGLSGFITWTPELGWAAALMAVMTAYVRVLGGACEQPQKFLGPMAKQHRMALLTIIAVIACFLPADWAQSLFFIVLWVITLGAFWTTLRRTSVLMADLRKDNER